MPSNKRCCVPDCISYKAKSKLALHRIPTNKLLAEKWLQTMKNSKIKVFKSSRICGRHFERHQYKDLRKNILKKGAIPVLFMPKPTANPVHNSEKIPNNSLEDTTLRDIAPKLNENSSESTSIPIKSYDFYKTCRICLTEKQDLQNMESDFIQNMFKSSDILKFSANDLFPKQICAVCLGELKVVYSFSLKCGKSSDVFRNYEGKFTNSEQITNNSSVDKKGLSKTVEVSYVPSEAEMRNSEDKNRTFNYKLIAVDGIQKPELSSLLSLTQLKETSVTSEKPILSSTIQAFTIQSPEKQNLVTYSSDNADTSNLDNNSTNPSISTPNKCTLDPKIGLETNDFAKSKSIEEVRTTSNNKCVLRKRKSKENIVQSLSSKKQALVCVVPIEKTKIPLNQAAIMSVSAVSEQEADLTDVKVVHHSRAAKRQTRILSRTARRKSRSRRSRSRSIRSRSRTLKRSLRVSTRKRVASGNAVYWYDKKPGEPSLNQTNTGVSKELGNGNENSLDTSTDYELLGFDQKGKSIVSEMKDSAARKSINNDTADKSIGLAEKTGGSAERTAGSAERNAGSAERTVGSAVTAGSVERIASSAERISVSVGINAGSVERTAGLAGRNAGSVERIASSAERISVSVERNAGSAERNAGSAVTASSVERIASSAERISVSVEKNAGSGVTAGSVERITSSAEKLSVSVERNAGSVKRIAASAQRTAGSASTAGSVERIASSAEKLSVSAERNADSTERTTGPVGITAGSVERIADSTERTAISAERTADSAEITANAVMNAHTDMPKPQIKQTNTTNLQCQPTKLNINGENTNSVVPVQKRGRGRPRKREVLPTVKLETVCLDTFDLRNSNTATQASQIGNNVPCNIVNDNSLKVTTKNDKCNIENHIVMMRNDRCNIENNNTSDLIPKNDKCNINNSVSAKCNNKSGNRVKRSAKKNKPAERNAKIGNTVTNIKNNNSTISEEKQNCVPDSKTDNIIGNTAQELPIEEPVTSSKDCQHNSDKTTKQNKTSIDIFENEAIYMKLRHKNVKFSVNSRKSGKLRHDIVNIKHLHISKKEFNKLLNVKLELNKFKIKNMQRNHTRPKININKGAGKKKVRIFNKTTTENGRVLRSTKINNEKSALINCNVENIKLDEESALQDVPKLELNIDKDKNVNDKTAVKVSEPNNIKFPQKEDDNSSGEDIKPKQNTCLENSDTISAANTSFKDETSLKNNNTDDETSETNLDNSSAESSVINVKNATEHEPCENIKTEVDNKCSPDTTTKYDTYSLNTVTDNDTALANNKLEHASLLNSTTDCSKCSVDTKAKVDSQNTVIVQDYCSVENEIHDEPVSLNYKTECLPNTIKQDSLANNVIELDPLEKSPVNVAIDNSSTDNDTKSQLIELLHEFVVFTDQNRISSTADESCLRTELTDVPTEVYSSKNYLQPLDGTNNLFTDTEVINSDAMLSNVQKLSPELKPGVPTVYDDELNESFEITINNILNTECNTICDSRLVGSGIVLEDVAVSEEVLPTEESAMEPVLYQHVPGQSPQFRLNCDSVYFNKRTGMIVTSLPTEETSSEDEYYTTRFHNAWVPVVQPLTESSTILFDNVIVEPVPSTSSAIMKHNGVLIPSSNVVGEQNLAYQCKVCNRAFHTRGQLNCHTISAAHFTKRFCKYCDQSVDIAEFDQHIKRHENESFCCEYCGEMVYDLNKFLRHSRIHRRHKCQLCPMEFETKFLMSQHLTVHTGVRRDQCRYCHRKFVRPSALITHLAARTCLKDKGKFVCTVCKKMFDSKKKSMQHVALHQRYECSICNRTFSSEQYCKKHLRLVHDITSTA